MPFKFNFKARIVVNGKEYSNFKEAVQAGERGRPLPDGTGILFRGVRYESLEAMPGDVRRLYEQTVVTVAAEPAARPAVGRQPGLTLPGETVEVWLPGSQPRQDEARDGTRRPIPCMLVLSIITVLGVLCLLAALGLSKM